MKGLLGPWLASENLCLGSVSTILTRTSHGVYIANMVGTVLRESGVQVHLRYGVCLTLHIHMVKLRKRVSRVTV